MPSTLAILAHPTQADHLITWLSKHERVLTHFQIMAPAEMTKAMVGPGIRPLDPPLQNDGLAL